MLEHDMPLVKSHVACMVAEAVRHQVAPLSDILGRLSGGCHHPLAMICLQQLHKLQGPEWLAEAVHTEHVDLLSLLPSKSFFNHFSTESMSGCW